MNRLSAIEKEIWVQVYAASFANLERAGSTRDREADALYAIKQADQAVEYFHKFKPTALNG